MEPAPIYEIQKLVDPNNPYTSKKKKPTKKFGKRKREVEEDSEDDENENAEQSDDLDANDVVNNAVNEVSIPLNGKTGGTPAFSIHADKVYILYPSLFQDPNIFGRFSIPQNINLDPVPDKTVAQAADIQNSFQQLQEQQKQQQILEQKRLRAQKAPRAVHLIQNQHQQQIMRRQSKREAENPMTTESSSPEQPQAKKQSSPKKSEVNQKRNVEAQLTGSIVVLNQDVNEYNLKNSY
jgi:hypothetical protein